MAVTGVKPVMLVLSPIRRMLAGRADPSTIPESSSGMVPLPVPGRSVARLPFFEIPPSRLALARFGDHRLSDKARAAVTGVNPVTSVGPAARPAGRARAALRPGCGLLRKSSPGLGASAGPCKPPLYTA